MRKSQMLGMVLVIAWQSVAVTMASAGQTDARKSMGNCFDIVFHKATDRLFVAGSAAGIHAFNVKNGELHFSATMVDGGYYRRLALAGDRVCVADSRRGLVVLNIAREDPICVWKQQDVQGMGLSAQDNRVYLAAGPEGLYVFDLSKPDSPRQMGRCKTNGVARDVWANGKYAYVLDDQQGLTVVDVTRASRPRKSNLVTWGTEKPRPEVIRGEGNRLYIAAGSDGLVILDIGTPRKPTLISRYTPLQGGSIKGLAVENGVVCLAINNGDDQNENGLAVLDVRDPRSPKLTGRCPFPGDVQGLCLVDSRVFVANAVSGIRSVDISDPNHPTLVDSFGPARESEPAETKQVAFYETEITPPERELIAHLVKTLGEVLQGREFRDLSTPVNAFLTLLSAYQRQDPDTLVQVLPVARQNPRLASAKTGAQLLGGLGKATAFRVEVDDNPPQESDLAAIYASTTPDQKIDQVLMFGYIDGAWRFLGGASNILKNWRPTAKQVEAITREILQK